MRIKYICSKCSAKYSLIPSIWRCKCGGLLDLEYFPDFTQLDINPDFQGMWRYRKAIPIENNENIISFDEGFTPLSQLELDRGKILIKQDNLFPTASYKDRGASVLISKAREFAVSEVIEDSSGNAGCSISAYCAKAGIKCEILVPSSTSKEKLFQISSYGSKLTLVNGSRDDTAKAAYNLAEEKFYASHVWNPFFFHGTKTFAYEIVEQLGWISPDTVILPLGNGTIFLGAYIGFRELTLSGIISKIPRFIAVQSANCAPILEKFKKLPHKEPEPTLAEGIAIGEPARIDQLISIVNETGGDILSFTDRELIDAHKIITGKGYFIEPTSAAVIAGARKYLCSSSSSEKIVSILTGHGLKSAGKAKYLVQEEF